MHKRELYIETLRVLKSVRQKLKDCQKRKVSDRTHSDKEHILYLKSLENDAIDLLADITEKK